MSKTEEKTEAVKEEEEAGLKFAWSSGGFISRIFIRT
jgi:hypothetical protein